MTETVLYCYECRQSTLQGTSQSIAEPLCPQCQSAFVEITEQPAPVRIPMGVFDPNLRLFQGSAGDASQVPPEAMPTMGNLQQMLSVLLGQGVQFAVHGVHGDGLPGQVNIGDFALGGMEAVMNQLMEQYQPQNQPTAQETRDTLPRRKVPASGDVKPCATYAPGATCKAGEPCTVCHTEFEAEQEVVQLPCEHCFHEGCIMPWLELHNTCPICRAELPREASSHAPAPEGTDRDHNVTNPQQQPVTWEMAMEDLARIMSLGPGGPALPGPHGVHLQGIQRTGQDWPLSGSDEDDEEEEDDSMDDSGGEEHEYGVNFFGNEVDHAPSSSSTDEQLPALVSERDSDPGEAVMYEAELDTNLNENPDGRAGPAWPQEDPQSNREQAYERPESRTQAAGGASTPCIASMGDRQLTEAVSSMDRDPTEDYHQEPGAGNAERINATTDGMARGSSGNIGGDAVVNNQNGRGGGVFGAVANPVGWVLRGAWHMGSTALGRMLP